MPYKEICLSLLTGTLLGGIFCWLGLPIPAPPTLSGIMGIIGIFLGYLLASSFFKH